MAPGAIDAAPSVAVGGGVAVYSSKRWRRLRRAVFRRDGYRCRSCGRRGRLEADHVVPIAAGGDPWHLDNLQALCRSCHIRKTARENRRRPRVVPDDVAAWAPLVSAMLDDG